MKLLLVNGCSFTEGPCANEFQTVKNGTWPYYLDQKCMVMNLASSGAGNSYICRSTINYIETSAPDPANTLIIIMWSGTSRIDVSVSDEWYKYIKTNFSFVKSDADCNWIHTGSSGNVDELKDFIRVSSPRSLCIESLQNFIMLENYLKAKGYRYLFTSYVNYWNDKKPYNQVSRNDYNIGYHCKDSLLYQNFDFSNWFFVNEQQDCLGEFAIEDIQNRSDRHPGPEAHAKFAKEIVLPRIQQIHM